MDAHPTVDDLAAYAAGDLDDAASAQIRDHATDCADCLHDLAALRSVDEQLAELPAATMPADIARRIDAAIAAERAHPAETATVLPMATRRRRLSAWTAGLAAGSVAAALIGVVAVSAIRSGDDGKGGADVAAARRAGGIEPGTVLRTGTVYTPETAAGAVNNLLSGRAAVTSESGEVATDSNAGPLVYARSPSAAPMAGGATTQRRLLGATAREACLATITTDVSGAAAQPLVYDYGFFKDKPALVIVLPGQTGDDRADVYFVGEKCGTNGDADLLYFARIARD